MRILADCIFERHPRKYTTPITALVDQVYLIHYTRNLRRRRFQLEQLPRLGVPLAIVTGYDADHIDARVRGCLLESNSTLTAAYASQTIKLYAALYDMLIHCHRSVLVFEDDAVLRYQYLHSLALALGPLRKGNFSVLFAGSYSTDAKDFRATGLQRRSLARSHTFLPAVGVAIAVPAARHILQALPVVAPIDATLSQKSLASCPCGTRLTEHAREACYYLKPYPVKAGSNGINPKLRSGLFGGEGVTAGGARAMQRDVTPSGLSSSTFDATEVRAGRVTSWANASWCCEKRTSIATTKNALVGGLPRCASVCLRAQPQNGSGFCTGCRLRWSWPALPTLPASGIADKHLARQQITCLRCGSTAMHQLFATPCPDTTFCV